MSRVRTRDCCALTTLVCRFVASACEGEIQGSGLATRLGLCALAFNPFTIRVYHLVASACGPRIRHEVCQLKLIFDEQCWAHVRLRFWQYDMRLWFSSSTPIRIHRRNPAGRQGRDLQVLRGNRHQRQTRKRHVNTCHPASATRRKDQHGAVLKLLPQLQVFQGLIKASMEVPSWFAPPGCPACLAGTRYTNHFDDPIVNS